MAATTHEANRLLLRPLVGVPLAQAHDDAERLDVEAIALGFGIDAADIVCGQRGSRGGASGKRGYGREAETGCWGYHLSRNISISSKSETAFSLRN